MRKLIYRLFWICVAIVFLAAVAITAMLAMAADAQDLCDNPQPGPYPYPVNCQGAPPPPGMCVSWKTWGNPQFNPGYYFVPDGVFVCRVFVNDTDWQVNFFAQGGRNQCLLGICVQGMGGDWVRVSSIRHIDQVTVYTQAYERVWLPVVER